MKTLGMGSAFCAALLFGSAGRAVAQGPAYGPTLAPPQYAPMYPATYTNPPAATYGYTYGSTAENTYGTAPGQAYTAAYPGSMPAAVPRQPVSSQQSVLRGQQVRRLPTPESAWAADSLSAGTEVRQPAMPQVPTMPPMPPRTWNGISEPLPVAASSGYGLSNPMAPQEQLAAPSPTQASPGPANQGTMPMAQTYPSCTAPGYGGISSYPSTYAPQGCFAPGIGSSGFDGRPIYGPGLSSLSGGSAGCTAPAYSPVPAPAANHLWFASVNALIMTRDEDNHWLYSYDMADESRQLLDVRDVSMSYAGGVEAHIGRYLNCGCNAAELVYWGLYPGDGNAVITDQQVPGGLGGVFNWNDLTYNGQSADQFVDNARAHGLVSQYNMHNVEVNLLGVIPTASCGVRPNVTWNWLAGLRYFRYGETIEFVSDPNDYVFTGDPDEIYFRNSVKNNLFGFQIGGDARFWVTPCLAITTGTRLGLLAVYSEYDGYIGGAAGTAVINNGPYAGRSWHVVADKEDVAMLGELSLGAVYQVGPRWRLTGGYRAMAISDIALPSSQLFHDLRGLNDYAVVDTSCGFILHGGYAGMEFCF